MPRRCSRQSLIANYRARDQVRQDGAGRAHGRWLVSTVGRLGPHLEVTIVCPATRSTVTWGQTGGTVHPGHSVMLRYWNNPDKTAEAVDAGR